MRARAMTQPASGEMSRKTRRLAASIESGSRPEATSRELESCMGPSIHSSVKRAKPSRIKTLPTMDSVPQIQAGLGGTLRGAICRYSARVKGQEETKEPKMLQSGLEVRGGGRGKFHVNIGLGKEEMVGGKRDQAGDWMEGSLARQSEYY